MLARLSVASAILFAGLALAPPAAATDAAEEVPAEVNAAIALLDCQSYAWDSDQDGHAETWQVCSTPQCGCYCPIVGAQIQIETPTEEHNYVAAASCQSGYGRSTEAGDGGVGVTVTPIFWGAGLDPYLEMS